jgi:hypothetical protein
MSLNIENAGRVCPGPRTWHEHQKTGVQKPAVYAALEVVARAGVEPPTPAFSELGFPVFPTTSKVAVGLPNTGKYKEGGGIVGDCRVIRKDGPPEHPRRRLVFGIQQQYGAGFAALHFRPNPIHALRRIRLPRAYGLYYG